MQGLDGLTANSDATCQQPLPTTVDAIVQDPAGEMPLVATACRPNRPARPVALIS